MKKTVIIFVILSLFIFLLFIGCSVNSSTGLIHVKNETHMPIKDLSVGGIFITGYLEGGSYYDYWYFEKTKGKLVSQNIKTNSELDGKILLEPGYWVTITAQYNKQTGEEELIISVKDHGTNDLDFEDWYKD